MRTKQKAHPNFSIVVMEVNNLSTHLGAHPTVHVNEVIEDTNNTTQCRTSAVPLTELWRLSYEFPLILRDLEDCEAPEVWQAVGRELY
jgi:hypothetical protein